MTGGQLALEGLTPEIPGGAEISPCGTFRYRLWRSWASGPRMLFVMLNPSTADGDADDPTIRRCVGFARRDGCDGIEVVNLYAYRATDPKNLRARLAAREDAVGPRNREAVAEALAAVEGPIVVAWGGAEIRSATAQGALPAMLAQLDATGRPLLCLGQTLSGAPRHPLYVPGAQQLAPWIRPAR